MITTRAYHALFMHNMLIRPTAAELESFGEPDYVILNAGALTHTSLALYDAIRSIRTPVVEVHISNPHAREEYRHKTFVGMAAKGSITGFGAKGYLLALEAAAGL